MQIKSYQENRSSLLPLFALADDSPSSIASYSNLGELYVAYDKQTILGYVQIMETGEAHVLEIKSIAVMESRQGQGIGRRLVSAAIEHCRKRHADRLVVSTASADIGNLRFYQRLGFRMSRIVRDAFGPSTGYPEGLLIDGIPLRDQVVFELDLKDSNLPVNSPSDHS